MKLSIKIALFAIVISFIMTKVNQKKDRSDKFIHGKNHLLEIKDQCNWCVKDECQQCTVPCEEKMCINVCCVIPCLNTIDEEIQSRIRSVRSSDEISCTNAITEFPSHATFTCFLNHISNECSRNDISLITLNMKNTESPIFCSFFNTDFPTGFLFISFPKDSYFNMRKLFS